MIILHLLDIQYRKIIEKIIKIMIIKVKLTLKNMSLIKNKYIKKTKNRKIYFTFQTTIIQINHIDILNWKSLVQSKYKKACKKSESLIKLNHQQIKQCLMLK